MESPKVFISYSWTTPEHEQRVLNIATELVESGIDVIIDKWNLKEGDDADVFMEQMVSDPSIKKVLIICDKMYSEKSDKRKGGAGTEAQIISRRVYEQQSNENKFVVAAFEMNEETGKPYLPVYYGARMYDPVLLTWNSIDPLCENYYNISPYAYCANSPVMYIDPTGMDYWSTNDPNVISEFLNYLKNFGFSNLDYKKWHHTTDADFLANLSYNDQTNKYYYSHGTVENGEVVCYSKTFDLDNITDTKWWNSIGQYNTDIAAATGAAEYKLGNSYRFATAYTIHDNRGNVLSTSKPKVRIPNTKIEVDAKMVGKMAKGARILGYGTGILSGIITGKEILYGEKDIIGEGGIDLIMTGVGFVGPYGWVFSSAYFLGKYALE